MNYKFLKELINQHSVTGDTEQILNFLQKYLKKQGIKTHQNGYGTLLIGNLKNPKKLIASHIDEVGFQVSQILKNGKVKVLPIGWVFANRLDHQAVYIQTKKGRVYGLAVHNEELKTTNVLDTDSLFIDIGASNKKEAINLGITVGQTGTFYKNYIETKHQIISAALDNKISQFVILEILKKNKNYLKDNAFAFITDEEMEDHSANGIAKQMGHVDFCVVLDYCPIHQKTGKGDVLGERNKGPLVLYRGGNYILHERVRNYFESKIKNGFQKAFLSSNTVPVLEPSNFEENGNTKAVNVCIPAYGYHGAYYSVNKKDIEDFKKLVLKILDTPFK